MWEALQRYSLPLAARLAASQAADSQDWSDGDGDSLGAIATLQLIVGAAEPPLPLLSVHRPFTLLLSFFLFYSGPFSCPSGEQASAAVTVHK